jgi:hypothetical protein
MVILPSLENSVVMGVVAENIWFLETMGRIKPLGVMQLQPQNLDF